jgi:hypothetical protein
MHVTKATILLLMAILLMAGCSSGNSKNDAQRLSKTAAAGLPAKPRFWRIDGGNKYFMDKWPDPGTNFVKDKKRPSKSGPRTYYEG